MSRDGMSKDVGCGRSTEAGVRERPCCYTQLICIDLEWLGFHFRICLVLLFVLHRPQAFTWS